MKIAMISSGFLPVVDGISVAVFHRVKQLSHSGHTVRLLCPDYSELQHLYPDWRTYIGQLFPNVRVVPLESSPALGLDFERDVKPRAYRTVLSELQSFQPDIVHVDEPERLAFCFLKRPGIAYARKQNIPCVGFFHTHYIDYLSDYVNWPKPVVSGLQFLLKGLFGWIYRAYDVTLIASPTTAQKVRRMGIKNTVQDCFLGLDTSSYRSAQRTPNFFEATFGLEGIEGTTKLIFVGRLTPDKGWAFTVRALEQWAQITNPDQVSVIIVGDGPLRNSIEQELRAALPHVYCLGRVPVDKMPALFVNSDIHVTASEKETTGLTVLEAGAAGIPVIAPRAGGVADHIEHGRNGLLYRPQDQDDFVTKLKFLVENATARKDLGHCGREKVASYDWEKVVERLLNQWNEQIHLR
ncbi:MAG: glycosyltransferase [Thermosynechococcaceae cyanobacterium]